MYFINVLVRTIGTLYGIIIRSGHRYDPVGTADLTTSRSLVSFKVYRELQPARILTKRIAPKMRLRTALSREPELCTIDNMEEAQIIRF